MVEVLLMINREISPWVNWKETPSRKRERLDEKSKMGL